LLVRAAQVPNKVAPRPVAPARKRAPTGVAAEAIKAFNDGNLARARDLLQGATGEEARTLDTQIEEFQRTYEAGLAEHRGKRAFNAIKLLTQAKGLEAKISGESKQAPIIDAKLADMYYVLGMQAYLAQKLPEAAEDFRTAVNLAPDHALSSRKLTELEQKSRDMLAEALEVKGSDTAKARALLQTVVEMGFTAGDVSKRAKKALDALK
ncbi:MAG TPA: hypothetical protein VFH51_03245, partial [Myxococcota bacterium]|nr:hypothetical protein [Myxococcota bacterium]